MDICGVFFFSGHFAIGTVYVLSCILVYCSTSLPPRPSPRTTARTPITSSFWSTEIKTCCRKGRPHSRSGARDLRRSASSTQLNAPKRNVADVLSSRHASLSPAVHRKPKPLSAAGTYRGNQYNRPLLITREAHHATVEALRSSDMLYPRMSARSARIATERFEVTLVDLVYRFCLVFEPVTIID